MAAPAKKTTTKKTAVKKAVAKQPQQTSLYVVPDGWEYSVAITNAATGAQVRVDPSEKASNVFEVSVQVEPDGPIRTSSVTSMKEGLLAASKAAKALADIAKKRAALEAAENDALGFISDEPVSGSTSSSKGDSAGGSTGGSTGGVSGLDDVD